MTTKINKDTIVEQLEQAISQYHRTYQIALLKMHYQPGGRSVRPEISRPRLSEAVEILMENLCGRSAMHEYRQYEDLFDHALENFCQLLESPDLQVSDKDTILIAFKDDTQKALMILTRSLNNLVMHLFPMSDAQVIANLITGRRNIA
jgi:hypothetical protein